MTAALLITLTASAAACLIVGAVLPAACRWHDHRHPRPEHRAGGHT